MNTIVQPSLSELQFVLSSLLDLSLQTRQAHWNVAGAQFLALHRFLGKMYEELDGHADDVAERLVQLEGYARGVAASVVDNTMLASSVSSRDGVAALVEPLIDGLKQLSRVLNEAFEAFTKAGDNGTADLLVGVLRALDKKRWMLEAGL